MNYPKITKIIKIKKENFNVKTIKFQYPEYVVSGQFFMIWIPGIDEIPMSVSYVGKNIKGITFKRVGDATKKLFDLKEGDKIGVRGPYGNGFKIIGKKILLVAGGTGIAMIAPIAEEINNKKISASVIIGAKNKEELFFENRLKKLDLNLYISTNNGSKGFKGLATDLAKELSKENKFDSVLTCGPELMMKKLYEIFSGVYFQASLERYIKCGVGLCGQCCVGEGLRVCKEGPIFDNKMLKNIKDFGVFKKDAAGVKIKF
ncbi:MAG: dihydroorotate dehydrogenase electron transfer subunit [Candidatus Thermoplasmatota archaeon]|jgi:dihydroorotate dehydrogenase electron transfer subunit|nr:dihydroorotate dehydrogenase electron transfer subunit [Candidatus Thermoplasmatota archaeon]